MNRSVWKCLGLLGTSALLWGLPRIAHSAPATPAALTAAQQAVPRPVLALKATDFMDSLGTQSAISVRGETFEQTVKCVQYLGVRWLRAGIEGDVPLQQFLDLHRQTGVRFSWGLGSGNADLPKLLSTARQLAPSGALLAFEGPNEPNNWGLTYQGQEGGGGQQKSWVPVANLMRDLYVGVKSDPLLKSYPVFSTSEAGAQVDNVGLQFLTIPPGANTLLPPGTRFADYANVHNYIYHPNSPEPADNKTWNAADPGPDCRVDGLYGEYGVTWGRKYQGYTVEQLKTLPRVTTETGTTIGPGISEEYHGLNLLSLYLDQFKRGWAYTNVYLLRDRVDEGGNQKFGFFNPDYTPRKAATYLHNLTTILADKGKLANQGKLPKPGALAYAIPNPPATVHDMLLQKSDGGFCLVVWNERVHGADVVSVRFPKPHQGLQIYDPTQGTDPIPSPIDNFPDTVTNLRLVLSDRPLIISIPAAR